MRQGCLAWMAVTACSAALTGCTHQEYERQLPDGTRERYRYLHLEPRLEMWPGGFRIEPAGTTDHGWPVDRLVPLRGGRPVYRVIPPGRPPVYFEPVPADKPIGVGVVRDQLPDLHHAVSEAKSAPLVTLRVRVDLSSGSAWLDRSRDGVVWEPLRQGSIGQVAHAAAELGLDHAIFHDITGRWEVHSDSTFPLVGVWLDDALMQVEPIGP